MSDHESAYEGRSSGMLKNYRNMGDLDRIARTLIGCVLVYASVFHGMLFDGIVLRVVVGLFGLTNVVSAILGVCPAYVISNVSTCSIFRGTESIDVDSGEDKSLKRTRYKLLATIAIPAVLTIVIFSWSLYQIGSRYAISRDVKQGELVAELAYQILSAHHADSEGELLAVYRRMSSETLFLAVHDTEGTILPTPVSWLSDDQLPLTEILRGIKPGNIDFSSSLQGLYRQGPAMILWSTIPYTEQRALITVGVEPKLYSQLVQSAVGTRVFGIAAMVLWLAIWGAMYIAKKFTQRVAASANELRYRSLHDELTGLLNKAGLDQTLSRKLNPMSDERCFELALLMLDMNGFRAINDTLGHSLGDRLIQETATRLVEAVGTDGIVCRRSGDVFAVVSELYDGAAEINQLRSRLEACVQDPIDLGFVQIRIDFRIGISLFPDNTADAGELVRFADIAITQAKRSNQNYSFYNVDKDAHSVRRLALLSGLGSAIENNEMYLVYQPKLDLGNNSLVGVEVLARWKHPQYGEIPPGEFIEFAEQSGMINKLTHWVLQQASEQCGLWRSQGMNIPMAVNLSPSNLHDLELPGLLKSLVTDGYFSEGLLELELTENAVMQDPDVAIRTMGLIGALGIPMAIDDFGTGLSSFTYLQKFPINNIKIDRSFVKDLAQSHRDSVLIQSMVDLAHNLGSKVTAEGVEDQKTLDKLRSFKCDLAQGFFICRPVTADQIVKWLGETSWVNLDKAA